MDRREEKGRATRDTLIKAARSLFGQHGYDGTSIEAILEASGVARGALYHHFANKAELFDAVLDREVARIAEAAASAARRAGDPLASLRAGCATWLREALDPAVQQIALLDSPAVVGWNRWREIDEQHTLGRLRANVKRIADDGAIPADEVDVLTNMVLAAVAEAALVIARHEDPDAALDTGLRSLDTLLTRVFTTPPRP
jgi:AcrR family transcriptional regulator